MRNKVPYIAFGAIWIFLCCYFMQLFNFPNVLTILFGGAAITILAIKQKHLRIDISTFFLVLTIASYFIIVYGQRAFTMSLTYVSIIIYILAHYLGCEIKNGEKIDCKYILLLFTIIVGYSVRGILNSYLFLDGQFQYPDTVRLWKDIWADWYMPGTWQVIFFLPMIACVFPAVAYIRKRTWVSLLLIFNALFFVYISLISESRTSIVILPIIFCAQMLMYIVLQWSQVRKLFTKKNIKIATGIFAVILIGGLLILKESDVISRFLSIMDRDGGILNNVRFKLHRLALEQLFIYPMGGEQMVLGQPHPHNTWLDMAFKAGVIPFFCFIAYTVLTAYEFIRWAFKSGISTERKILTAGLYGAFFLYYTIERSFVGSVHFMTPWLFVNGLIHGELSVMKEKLKCQGK